MLRGSQVISYKKYLAGKQAFLWKSLIFVIFGPLLGAEDTSIFKMVFGVFECLPLGNIWSQCLLNIPNAVFFQSTLLQMQQAYYAEKRRGRIPPSLVAWGLSTEVLYLFDVCLYWLKFVISYYRFRSDIRNSFSFICKKTFIVQLITR